MDTTTGDHVVVKTLAADQVTPVVEALLEHEAHVLSRLDSPWVAPLRAVGRKDGRLYLVTPFVPGTSLAEHLAERPLSVRETVQVGIDLLSALRDVHELGVVHRDVKPSNLVLTPPDAGGRALLIDFGFAWSVYLDVPARDQAAGTVRYMAPETAGLIDATVDERADLYSAGVTLYEALAGDPPFDGGSVGEVLQQHLTHPVPELRRRGFAVPRALDEILQRLLRKDPHDRYGTTTAAFEDLARLRDALEAGEEDPPLVVGIHERRSTLAAPAFVGRQDELGELRGTLADAEAGTGGLTFLEAPSGGGKTRLLSEFANDAVQAGAWVLHGQALDQAAPRPFQMLAGIADGLLVAARRDAELARTLVEQVGEHAEAVVDALPALGALFERSAATLGPEEHGEQRIVQALARLLETLGSLEHPTVVVLDDCQWADQLTLKVLRAWWASTSPTEQRLLIIAAFRSEEVDAGHRLRTIRPTRSLELAPLDRDDLRGLVESMAGRLPEAAHESIERLSDGSPFMASAILRGMVESRALVRTTDGWEVVAQAMAELSSSRHAAAVLAQRLELLSEPTLVLLRIGAVLGKQFDLDLLADLAGMPLGEAVAGLHDARQRHIVWLQAEEGRAAFAHDKLRETVLREMEAGERRRWHRHAAARLRELDDTRVFDLAYHFDAAGEPERALDAALQAAMQARAQHSLEVAEQQYRIAERGAAAAGDATRHEIALGLGEVAMLRGRYAEAERTLTEAAGLTQDPEQLAIVEGHLGSLAFKRGDSAGAAARIEAALRSLGRRVPRRPVTYRLWLMWEVLVQLAHTVAPGVLVGRRNLEQASSDLLAARLYSRLTHAYWFSRGGVATLWSHLRGMNLTERYPPSKERAQAYSEHAPVMTLLTLFSRGTCYVQRSLEIRRDLGDVWGQGQSLHFYGLVLYASSRYEASIDRCEQAIRLLERTGDLWELNTARWHVAYAHYRLGDLATAVEIAQYVHRSGSEIGDTQARGIALSAWAKATDGQVPAELLRPELAAVGDDVHTGAEVLQAEAIRLLAEQRADEAERLLLRARRLVFDAMAVQEYVAPLFPWLASVRRVQLERASPYDSRHRRRLRRRARRAALVARLVARRYRNNLPQALRESAMISAAAGRRRRARRWLERSQDVAVAQGARAEQARTRIALGEVGRALGWPGADDDLDEGRSVLAAMLPHPAVDGLLDQVTPSLVARFDAILETGRKVASALTLPDIYQEVHDAAVTLLRGETCVVLDRDADSGTWQVVHGDPEAPWSRALLETAVEQGRPVRAHEQAPDSSSQSLLLSDIRSGLCTPLYGRGVGDACFVVANRQVSALYGEDEERLAGYIATIAGAAIENARNFAEIRALTRSLEDKVAERTAALAEALEGERRARGESDRRAALLESLATVGRRMNTLDPQRVLEVVVDTALHSGFDGAEVCVLDPERPVYHVPHIRGLPAGYQRDERPADLGIVGRVLERREVTVVTDYGGLPDADPTIRDAGFQMAVGAPLMSHGDLLGVLVAGRRTDERPSKDELEAFELIALQAGRALDNARVFEEQRRTVERLAEVDRLKDEFLSTASHELRTPLTVIGGMCSTLEARWEELAADGQAPHFLHRISANTEALDQIVETLLDFSRLQQDRLPVAPERVDLAEILQQVSERLESLFGEHELHRDIEPGLYVHADAALLHRAVENLLSNAAKYTPPGTRIILRGACEGKMVVAAVEDDGPGIDPADLQRLTERFFRGKEATIRPSRGLGLGLAFTEELLRLHGSRLEVDSELGAGATFAFRLPVDDGPPGDAEES